MSDKIKNFKSNIIYIVLLMMVHSIVLDGLSKEEIANLVINNIETIMMGDGGALDFNEAEDYEEQNETE